MSQDQQTALPRVSIVTPHLNDADALARCLDALAAQVADNVPFEVIVVDNGSRELPGDVVARHPFARLVAEDTPGPGPARTHGARLAQAPLLAFIDADCFARPGWVAGIVAYMDAHPQVDVIGGDVFIAPRVPGQMDGIEGFEALWNYRQKLFVERDGYAATCNMAVRREVFAQVGDFGGLEIAEDLDWGRRATAMGFKTVYVPEIAIETPARENFAELARKWDRHIGHDFNELKGLGDRLRWILRALLIAGSPVGEIGTVLGSDRLPGPAARLSAFVCLVRIRLYRTRRMLGLLAGGDGRALSERWRNG